MAEIHFLLGPVGAGKSTQARKLRRERGGVLFDLDDWMSVLYGEDERPVEGRIEWYLARRDRVLKKIWRMAQQTLGAGANVIFELGLIRRDDREAFLPELLGSGYPTTFYLVDAPREVRRERVLLRNRERGETFSMEVPLEVFEMASDLWEPPTDDEFSGYELQIVK